MKIALIIPAYNESKHIERILKNIKKVKIPVIFVDDGSSDNTFEILSNHKLTVLRHKINLGKGAALKTGCIAAFNQGYEAVIMMDSDGQHKVDDLDKFIDKLKSNKFDIVFGIRNLGLDVPLARYLGNKMASFIIASLFGIYISDLICGFRAFSKKTFNKIDWQSQGYGVETEMVIKAGKYRLRHCEVPIETVYYDKAKGVTIIDAMGLIFDVIKWRFCL